MESNSKGITVFIDDKPQFRITVTTNTKIGQIKKLFPPGDYEDMKFEVYKGKEVPKVLQTSKYDKTDLSSVFSKMKDAKIFLWTGSKESKGKKTGKDVVGRPVFPTGVKDIDMLILSRIENDRDLLNTLNANTVTRRYSNNEDLWRNRFMERFPEDFEYVKNIKKDNWKTFYLNLVSYLEQSRNYYNKALEIAARKGDGVFVDYFIYKETGVHNWNRALRSAAEGGHRELVDIFINNGADDWELGLEGAALGGHRDLVDFFIKKGAREWNEAMNAAALGGHRDLVDFFIKKGARDWPMATRSAAEGGHKDLIKFFLEKRKGDYFKEYMLMPSAARGGQEDLVRLYANMKGDHEWFFALGQAAVNGNRRIVDFLISEILKRKVTTRQDRIWNTGLVGAAKGGHWDLVNFFIKKGATDWNGAMLHAVEGGHPDLINFFIEKEKDWSEEDWDEAADTAVEYNYYDLVEFFRNK